MFKEYWWIGVWVIAVVMLLIVGSTQSNGVISLTGWYINFIFVIAWMIFWGVYVWAAVIVDIVKFAKRGG